MKITTLIPGSDSIELIAYYPEFVEYYPQCELQTKKWFVDYIKDNWIIFDCGANIGYYTILFSRFAPHGHIYAFEPTITYEMLLKNIQHHSLSNVTPVHMALGNKTGTYDDAIFRIWGKNPEIQKYEFSTLDDYISLQNIQHVDCIKIDVDSFDLEVLKGSKNTLLRYNPYVMVELNHALTKRGQSREEALQWLSSLGYSSFQIFDNENFLIKKSQ